MCGMGRVALPMVDFLDKKKRWRYDGFEIVCKGAEWCQKKYRQHTHFKFIHADVYNPEGTTKSSEYRFSYPDNTFDFVLLTSVFTHMMSTDMENYFREIVRVMKPGATSFITYFILNEDNLKLIKQGKMHKNFNFQYDYDLYQLVRGNDPEDAIGFKLDYLQKIYADNNLKIKALVLYGAWSGREQYYSFQDVIIAHK